MKKLSNYLILIVVVFMIFCLSRCNKNTIIKSLGGVPLSELRYTTDTLSRTIDSLKYEGDSLKLYIKNIKPFKVDSIVYKEIVKYLPNSNTGSTPEIPELSGVIAYETLVGDTLIEGTIKTFVNAQNCDIINQYLDYKPKFPILVTETITVEKTVERTIDNTKINRFGLGAEFSTELDYGIKGIYQYRDIQFQLGYKRYPKLDVRSNGAIEVGLIKMW